ncbi:CYTH and CHAD domain-containing protein [Streptomyces capparidis]
MVGAVREIERKYEASGEHGLPDLGGVEGVASVAALDEVALDAVYYDTADLRLAAAGTTLRRRGGGDDAGWHLKLPVGPDTRDEIRLPPRASEAVPPQLVRLVRARTRGAPLVPVARLRTTRRPYRLLDADGRVLAEVVCDRVTAEADGATRAWAEIEVELAAGDPALLDAVERRLAEAGITRSTSASKLARALGDRVPGGGERQRGREKTAQRKTPSEKTAPKKTAPKRTAPKKTAPKKTAQHKSTQTKDTRKGGKKKGGKAPITAGDAVLAYLRVQADALADLDAAVRRDLPDAVHRTRVACRRARSALRTFRSVLDPEATRALADELRHLGAELGADRDREVLDQHLRALLDPLPRGEVLGPVRGRLRTWSAQRRSGTRRRVLAALDSPRHLALLDAFDALLADPPLLPAAARPASRVLAECVLRDYRRLARRVASARTEEDRHEVRKAAKRARYAGEAAAPALGAPAKAFADRMKAVQEVLGEYQDGVVARQALRELAAQAHASGENAFTYGLLHERQGRACELAAERFGAVWREASRKRHRAALTG